MGMKRSSPLSLLLLVFLSCSLLLPPALAANKSYVVYLGGHSHGLEGPSLASEARAVDSHFQLLQSVLKSKEKAQDAMFYSYTKYINGFAANLDEEEALEISKCPGVISVFPNRARKLHTTRSWQFLGLENDGEVVEHSLWDRARFGEDTIIGNLDTGVWPESSSFKDEGMGPIPSRWKGICQQDPEEKFSCNRKLIGGRVFYNGYVSAGGQRNLTTSSARDMEGHGSHTLSTAAGAPVPNASVFGYGNGTARGGSPLARVAAYKVCWPATGDSGGCFDADILAAFEAAIGDGVDVLSVSLGGAAADYFADSIAIGAFHAVKNGITVVCSAGNDGPAPGSVSNVAPWIVTVGASTMDREFPAILSINNKHIKGQSLSAKPLPEEKFYPLIDSREAKAGNATLKQAELCYSGALDPEKVKGKIVVCLRGINARVAKGAAVKEAGGAGLVLANDATTGNEVIADAHLLPATHISYSDGLTVYKYLNSTKDPYGYITIPSTELDAKPAPFMASFSSQGPNTVNPEILKPDITAPGVSVIAAFSLATAPTSIPQDPRRIPYNSDSGTSMSCPHIAGIAGLLKTLHPDWSPSAIKSAIMTSASVRDNERQAVKNSSFAKATPFSYGAGHVWPNQAMDPGLVYDLKTSDYLNFLCALGYNSTQIATFSVEPYSCPAKPPKLEDLNYPSITVPKLSGPTTVTRTLKNVGTPGKYTVRVRPPAGVSVSVRPRSLEFAGVGEEKSFEVTLEARHAAAATDYVFGGLVWSDGEHYVRSTIVVKSKGSQNA